jgi:hypothetical protein
MPEYAHFTSPEAAEEIKATQVLNGGDRSIWGFLVGYPHVSGDIPINKLEEGAVCIIFETPVSPFVVDEYSAFWRWQDCEGELPITVKDVLPKEAAFSLLFAD